MIDIAVTIRSIPYLKGSKSVPFGPIARKTLGSRYNVSLVLCGDSLARSLNRTYRKKNYPANVLSFPIEKQGGEIFLNVRKAERESRTLGISPKDRIAHLFAHACLHLAGLEHSEKMDRKEKSIVSSFGFKKPE